MEKNDMNKNDTVAGMSFLKKNAIPRGARSKVYMFGWTSMLLLERMQNFTHFH